MNCLAKILLDSSSAAFREGPKTGSPRFSNSSAIPSDRGGQIDLPPDGELGQGGDVGVRNKDVLRDQPGAAVPGGAIDLGHPGALGQFPGERVLAPAGADDQDVHGVSVTRTSAGCP
jgi:hypothetical protein